MPVWTQEQYFREYDLAWVNHLLEEYQCKNTEWGKINHDNYRIIEDNYRTD
jgi:hypothetical protein